MILEVGQIMPAVEDGLLAKIIETMSHSHLVIGGRVSAKIVLGLWRLLASITGFHNDHFVLSHGEAYVYLLRKQKKNCYIWQLQHFIIERAFIFLYYGCE